jgi:hypothetical protein
MKNRKREICTSGSGRKKRAQACSLRRDELIDKGAIITGE